MKGRKEKRKNPPKHKGDQPRVWTFGFVDFSIEARARLKG